MRAYTCHASVVLAGPEWATAWHATLAHANLRHAQELVCPKAHTGQPDEKGADDASQTETINLAGT
jgi:hypothetical protein